MLFQDISLLSGHGNVFIPFHNETCIDYNKAYQL